MSDTPRRFPPPLPPDYGHRNGTYGMPLPETGVKFSGCGRDGDWLFTKGQEL
jgi:hypothetical protein